MPLDQRAMYILGHEIVHVHDVMVDLDQVIKIDLIAKIGHFLHFLSCFVFCFLFEKYLFEQ